MRTRLVSEDVFAAEAGTCTSERLKPVLVGVSDPLLQSTALNTTTSAAPASKAYHKASQYITCPMTAHSNVSRSS